MTKINQVICDTCGTTLDVNTEALGLFEYIEVKEKIRFQTDLTSASTLTPEKELVKVSKDLCRDCAKKIIEFCDKLKEENDKSQKGR